MAQAGSLFKRSGTHQCSLAGSPSPAASAEPRRFLPGISAVVSLLEMPATGCDALIGTDVMRHLARQVLFDFEAGEFKILWND